MEISLLLLASMWLLVLAVVAGLCLAARAGDSQQLVLEGRHPGHELLPHEGTSYELAPPELVGEQIHVRVPAREPAFAARQAA
jgi:hypothetical protein